MDNSALFKALVAFQGSVTNIARDQTARVQTTKASYSYSYTDIAGVIEAVKKPLAENGLCYVQLLDNLDGQPALTTVLAHQDGGSISSTVPMRSPDMQDPQKFGGLVTYYRRYALLAILGLATEDDDANHARTPAPQDRGSTRQQVTDTTNRHGNDQSPQSTPAQLPGASQGADEDMNWGELYTLTRPEGYPNRAALERLIGRHFDDLNPGQVFALFKEAHGLPSQTPPTPRPARGTLTDKQLNAIRVMRPKKGMDEKGWDSWVCYTLDIDSNTPPKPEELSKEQASTVIEELGNMTDNPQMQAILEASGR